MRGTCPRRSGSWRLRRWPGASDPISLTVPLANVAATDYLLGRGYRLDPFTMHLLEDRPVIQADRYILTTPPFFL